MLYHSRLCNFIAHSWTPTITARKWLQVTDLVSSLVLTPVSLVPPVPHLAHPAVQLLDEVLPTSAEAALQLVQAHAAAGLQGRFAATQLLHLAAACMVRR